MIIVGKSLHDFSTSKERVLFYTLDFSHMGTALVHHCKTTASGRQCSWEMKGD